MSFESRRADGLKRAKAIAEKHGGFLVSKEYINNQQKLEWKCANENHPTFLIKYNKVSCIDQWCPLCKEDSISQKRELKKINLQNFIVSKRKRVPLKERQEIRFKEIKKTFKDLGATVVSIEYINQYQQLEISCDVDKSHPNWFISACSIGNHKGCPTCYPKSYGRNAGKKRNKNSDLRKVVVGVAKEKNGKVVEYLPMGKGVFSCLIDGHKEWTAKVKDVVAGSWCKFCSYEKIRHKNKQLLEEFAIIKGGLCLNPENYSNNRTKLSWKCENEEHPVWKANFHSIKNLNSWCPECATNYKSEARTRAMLEYLLGYKLEKSYPYWLRNDLTDKNMELDGFNEKQLIAFEFQGTQHYDIVFGQSEEMLKKLQYRDALKKKLCEEKGITLLIIDESHKTKNSVGLFNEIIKSLQEKNVPYRSDVDEKKIEELFYSY